MALRSGGEMHNAPRRTHAGRLARAGLVASLIASLSALVGVAVAATAAAPAADVAKLNALRSRVGVAPVGLSAPLTSRCRSALRAAQSNATIPSGFDVDQVSWSDLLNPAVANSVLSSGERLDELLNPELATIGVAEATQPGAPGIAAPTPMTCWTPTLGLTATPPASPVVYTFPVDGQRFPGWELSGSQPLVTVLAPELLVFEWGGLGTLQSFELAGPAGPVPVTVESQRSDKFLVDQSWLIATSGGTPLHNGKYTATATFTDGVTHTWEFTAYGVVDRPELTIEPYDGQIEISSLSTSGIVTVTVKDAAGHRIAFKRAVPTKTSSVTKWSVPAIRRGGRFSICAVVAAHSVYAGSRLCKRISYAAPTDFSMSVSLGATTSTTAQVTLHAHPPVIGQTATVTIDSRYVYLGTDAVIWHHLSKATVRLTPVQSFEVPFQHTSPGGDIWEADVDVTVPSFHAAGSRYAATHYHGMLASRLP